MNIIFLDIDGVLNSNFWTKEHQKEISDGTLIDYDKILLLKQLVEDCNAHLILHSGWKYWFDDKLDPIRKESQKLKDLLLQAGLSIEGITPDLATDEIKASKKFSLVKADEILLWLQEHPTKAWIVIDDLDLHNDIIVKHQIMTDSQVGLTPEDIQKAKKLLQG